MLESGYIRLYRSMLTWEWYDDINTKTVFLHLLLTVNYEPQKWRGITVERGQRVASYGKLATETRLSVQSVRTAVKHLISTGELTHQTTAEYGLFTISNYDKYQDLTPTATVGQQSANSQPTVDQQQCNKAKKANKEKEEIPPISPKGDASVFFESIWKLYPNKKGKGRISGKKKRDLLAVGYEQLARCIERYKAMLAHEAWRQPQDGGTFFNRGYLDYLDGEHPETAPAVYVTATEIDPASDIHKREITEDMTWEEMVGT